MQSIPTALKCKPILWKKFSLRSRKTATLCSAMEKLQGNKVVPLVIGGAREEQKTGVPEETGASL